MSASVLATRRAFSSQSAGEISSRAACRAGSPRARTHPTEIGARIQPDLRIQIVHALSQLDSCTRGNLLGWPASQNPQISDRLLGPGSQPNRLLGPGPAASPLRFRNLLYIPKEVQTAKQELQWLVDTHLSEK